MSSKKCKLKPILDEKVTKAVNLKVLQRVDPCIDEILATAAHAVLYEFNPDTVEWTRKNVQGSLFVVKRRTQPQFQFIVMNHLCTENLVESLVGTFEYEVHGPYLLYRNHSEEVNGIWFYNKNDRDELADLFSRLCNESSQVPTESPTSLIKRLSFEFDKDAFLEQSTSKAADVADDRSFSNIFSPSIPLVPDTFQSIALETLQASASSPCTSLSSIPENSELEAAERCSTDLLKPSSFLSPYHSPKIMLPIASSVPSLPPLISPANLERPYGTLLLQPFPPPTSPQSFPPTFLPTPPLYGPVISREKFSGALQLLVQDDQFIDIVYRAVRDAL